MSCADLRADGAVRVPGIGRIGADFLDRRTALFAFRDELPTQNSRYRKWLCAAKPEVLRAICERELFEWEEARNAK